MDGLILLGAETTYTDAKTVAAVQAALVKLGGYDLGKSGPNKDGVDGDFGPKTKAAIKKLQKSLNTEAHGRIDEGVLMALKITPGVLPPGAATTIPTAGADYTDAKTVTAVQAALVKLGGYDLGKTGPNKDGVDGDFGPKTKAAIKKLQKSLNTEAHGRIDEGVLMALKITPGVLPPGVTMEGRAAVQAEAAVKAAKAAEAAGDKGDKPAAVQAAQAVVEAAPAQPPAIKEQAEKALAKVNAATTPAEVKQAAKEVEKAAEAVKKEVLPWWQERAWSGGPPRWQVGAAGGGIVGLGLLFKMLARR